MFRRRPKPPVEDPAPSTVFADSQLDPSQLPERPIGEILRINRKLSPAQVEQILEHQSKWGMRFGDAAVALGHAQRDDVLWALSQQFHYPYAAESTGDHHEELYMANEPFSDDVEMFRDLRSHLLMTVMASPDLRPALAIVSANVGDGKTFIAANLAVAFSQLPGRTLIVDADMRSPRLHKVFGLENNAGLSSILSGRAEPNVIRPVSTLPNLYMLPVGTVPPNPLELVQRSAFGRLVQELTAKFDYVLIDTPAAAHGSDARLVASRAGAALMVGRKNATQTKPAQKLVAQLTKSGVQLAGVVLNEF